jgi:hypothetical protein
MSQKTTETLPLDFVFQISRKAKASQQFTLAFAIVTAVGLLGIGGFNFLINPYGVLGSPTLRGVNQSKPKQLNQHRLVKAVEITKLKPDTVILGTSTVLRLSIEHPALSDGQSIYNLGLPGASMYEKRRYFQHALANQPNLKRVIIGLDFISFGSGILKTPDFSEERLEKQGIFHKDLINATLSLNAFSDSRATLMENLTSPSVVNAIPDELQADLPPDDGEKLKSGKSDQSVRRNFEGVIYSYFQKKDRYRQYQLSEEQLNNLKLIVEECRARNIEVKVFFSPMHAVQIEAIRTAGLWSTFEQWKRSVVAITPTWDFSSYNSVTTEPLSRDMKNFVDGTHYQYEIADLILNRMFDYQTEKIPSDFGVLLTPQTIEPNLSQIRIQQVSWRASHPDMVTFIDRLYKKANR